MTDPQDTVYLPNLSFSGYRSFGQSQVHFGRLSKVSILIGQNNSGKSNILRFVNDVLAPIRNRKRPIIGEYDRHLPTRHAINYGWIVGDPKDDFASMEKIFPWFRSNYPRGRTLAKLLAEKQKFDESEFGPWMYCDENGEANYSDWEKAFNAMDGRELAALWGQMTNLQGGTIKDWSKGVLDRLKATAPSFNSSLVPAIRQVGPKGSVSEGFDGLGIIERIAKLQNPGALHQRDREKFNSINRFLQSVTDNKSATIEIPFDRDTILVHIDGRVLPLESLGSGIHEVVILAAAATALDSQVVCMEEPELHLNPILQKKLVRYLQDSTTNQYLITTHSASLMDTPNSEVYHIELSAGASTVRRATSDLHKSKVCADLGYHPSDLLQTNCIVWVEGPSDRIYINWWIRHVDSGLIEGIHYSVMFYGGRLASHLSAEESSSFVSDFISLRRLNQHCAIVIDSDKANPYSRINDTKRRLRDEFNADNGMAWITEGREIENYVEPSLLKAAIRKVHPSSSLRSVLEKFDNCLRISSKSGREATASKVEVATEVTNSSPNLERFDLRANVTKLIKFIRNANPKISAGQ